jgi:DNA mismatch endonuclease (patch repair protein)
MSLIRSRGNKATELRLIEIFREHGITGWRRNQKLIGKPDFTFRRERVVVFVDGCFWHGCPKYYQRPKSNRKFWDEKIATNRKCDRFVSRELRGHGWHVIRVWQHQLVNTAWAAARVKCALERGTLNRSSFPRRRESSMLK